MNIFIKTKILVGLMVLGCSTIGWAMTDIGANDMEVTNVMYQRANSCGNGASGWWVELESQVINHTVSGSLGITNGVYYGCGTCGQCRENLNALINNTLSSLKAHCTQRGGVVKAEHRGDIKEDVKETSWSMRAEGVTVTCQKWVEC